MIRITIIEETYYALHKVLILFLRSTRKGFHALLLLLSIICHCCSSSLLSLSNALFSSCIYEAPPSEKHTVL